jgi:alpha-galactosidase
MSHLKIAAVGVGSFVFGPSVLAQTILENRLDDVELALVDVDAEVLDLMASVGQRMAQQAGVRVHISTHTERNRAFAGADFVICSVARQGLKRFATDCEIVTRYIPDHQITEFGGIAGISSSLRQIAMIQEIAADMRRSCPQAWLLNVANPLPRVCQAAHAAGIKTLGFCAVSLLAYSMAWQLLNGEALEYPFSKARKRWQVTTAGLNHFVWLVRLQDRVTGADLLPALRDALARGRATGNEQSETLARETGFLLVPHDNHTRDFLVPRKPADPLTETFHGTPGERLHRLALMRRIAQGEEGFDELLQSSSWERPVDVIAALAFGRTAELHALDMMNEGQIPHLPRSVFVETPCTVTRDGPAPHTVELPSTVLPLCLRTALVTDTIVQAALLRKRVLVHQAIELDPTVQDKLAGIRAIDACLEAHDDLLPGYE